MCVLTGYALSMEVLSFRSKGWMYVSRWILFFFCGVTIVIIMIVKMVMTKTVMML